jgi:Tol biopolymer transport system component
MTTRLVLALSATCLALVAIVATGAILSDGGGAESAGPVPSALSPGTRSGAQGENATPGSEMSVTVPGTPKVDYLLDLTMGKMTPLPEAIIRSLGESDERPPYPRWVPRYAASSDGSRLAYVGVGEEGSLQVFVAGIDGTGVRQLTHDPRGAMFPAWSPDGTLIAYKGSGGLLVLDVATGESTPIAGEGRIQPWSQLQFTPDGSSLLYTSGSRSQAFLRTVPIEGGKGTVLIGRDEGMGYAGNGSLSPDGSHVTMMGSEINGPGALRFVANTDGSELRTIPGRHSNPSGTWSPDGKLIVCAASDRNSGGGVIVVDVATGSVSPVAEGNGAIWLDPNTLLVEVS